MRNNPAKVKWPGYVLAGLGLLAIVLMIARPPTLPTPGPIGAFGYWKSTVANGTMAASAVNPAGTMWAGAWNETANGKTRSQIWVIDFEKEEAWSFAPNMLKPITAVSWTDNGSLASRDDKGTQLVQDVRIEKRKGEYTPGLSQVQPEAKPAYATMKMPGIVEGSWTSPSGTLIVCRHLDDFAELVFNPKTGKLSQIGKDGFTADVKNWPDAPKEMLFVTYRGGFKFDLVANKATKIFDYSDVKIGDEYWRTEVQDGHLYPRKDGNYVSVSKSADMIDIRILDKEGKLVKNLLPRS